LERLLNQARSELAVKSAVKDAADVVLVRSTKLCTEGLAGAQECDNARSQAEIGDREVASAQNKLSIAQFLFDAGKAGTDVAQDYGAELTYARQQRDDLTLRLANLRQQLETQTARARAVELRLHPPVVPITVTSLSRTWGVVHQSGAQVAKGEPLFQVVDCSQLFVFATATRNKYEQLRLGMTAHVKIGERTLTGKIAQLLGPYGTFSQDRAMQPQPPVIVNGEDATSAGVAIEVPELQALVGGRCEVGTQAEVTFVQ
jgi:transposase-like protein